MPPLIGDVPLTRAEITRRYRERHREKVLAAEREYSRRYRASHPDRDRLYDEAHREERREKARLRREADPEKDRAAVRRYKANNPEKVRARDRLRWIDNPEKESARNRRWRAANPGKARAKDDRKAELLRGGDWTTWFAQQWQLQDGRCYLCGDELTTANRGTATDHDHSCSCGPQRMCPYCRRGLACNRCNLLIGLAFDDPTRLRRIADNLETVREATRKRIATKPVQMELEAG